MKRALSLTAVGCLLAGLAGCVRQTTDRAHRPVERHALLVLYQKGAGGCVARTVEKLNAYVNDTVVWQILNECDSPKLVEIDFAGGRSPVSWIDGPSLTVNPGAEKRLSGRVNTGTVGSYNYVPKINGTPGADPRLDVDPY